MIKAALCQILKTTQLLFCCMRMTSLVLFRALHPPGWVSGQMPISVACVVLTESNSELLHLDENALTGTIPPIASESISQLRMERNKLSGQIPVSLSDLTTLGK